MKKTSHIDESLNNEDQEDLGLLLLMQQVDSTDMVSEDEVFDVLDEKS